MRLKASPSDRIYLPLNFRKLTIRTLLCGLLIAGQIPGWLHVSDCVEDSIASLSSSSQGACGCCIRSLEKEDSSSEFAAISSSKSRSGHDCSNCLICRSVVTNNAEQAKLYHFAEYQALQDISCESLISSYVFTRISFAQPRAPPLV